MAVIDVDGTLVNSEGNISEEDKLAVKRLQKSYVEVVLCTGRSAKSTLPVITGLGLKSFHIFCDGALIYNHTSAATAFSRPLEPATVREAVDFCRKNNLYLELYSTMKLFAEKPNSSDEINHSFFGVNPEFVNFDDILDKEPLLKAEMLIRNKEDAARVKLFKDNFGDTFNYSVAHSPAYPDVDFVNILHPQVSKGAAVKKIMTDYGYLPAEVIAIGDGLNDISMLEAVGASVAMGNAFDEVKKVANYITETVDNHGVASAINFFFPV